MDSLLHPIFRIPPEAEFYNLLISKAKNKPLKIIQFLGEKYLLCLSLDEKSVNKAIKETLYMIEGDRSLSVHVFYFLWIIASSKRGLRKISKFREDIKDLIHTLKEKENEDALPLAADIIPSASDKKLRRIFKLCKKLRKKEGKKFFSGLSSFISSPFFLTGDKRKVIEFASFLSYANIMGLKLNPRDWKEANLIMKLYKKHGEIISPLLSLPPDEIEKSLKKLKELLKNTDIEEREIVNEILSNVDDKKGVIKLLLKLKSEMKGIKKHLNRENLLPEKKRVELAFINVLSILSTSKKYGFKIIKELIKNNRREYLRVSLFKVRLLLNYGLKPEKIYEMVKEFKGKKLIMLLRKEYGKLMG